MPLTKLTLLDYILMALYFAVVRDGRVLGPPAELPLPTHAVRVVGDAIEVALSPLPP